MIRTVSVYSIWPDAPTHPDGGTASVTSCPRGSCPYLGLEEAASLIRTYEVHFVPGLLQTPDYTRAVVELGYGHVSAAEIDRRTELRQRRQEVLRRPSPPHLWAVIDEAVLRRPVGDEDVMRAQIEALIEASQLPTCVCRSCRSARAGWRRTDVRS